MVFSVSRSEAREAARCCLPMFIQHYSKPLPELWRTADFANLSFDRIFSEAPLEIADIKGRPLFRDFSCILPNGSELRVRTAADRRLGGPVISVGIHEKPWRLEESIEKAREELKRINLPAAESAEPILVCYSYPRLGLWLPPFLVADLRGGDPFLIGPGASGKRMTWSPLDLISNPATGVIKWVRRCNRLRTLRWNNGASLAARAGEADALFVQHLLPLKLEPQDDSTSCSPATAVMILGFHNIDTTEPEAVVEMKTSKNPINLGTKPADEVTGYQTLIAKRTNRLFEVKYDGSPTFEKIKEEISGRGLPFKSGIENGVIHSRAVAGWMYGLEGGSIYVCDPLHPSQKNQGTEGWELWSAYLHTDFVYVRPTAAA